MVDEISGHKIGGLALGDDELAGLIADYPTLGDLEKITVVAAVHGIDRCPKSRKRALDGDRVIFP